MPMFLNHTSFVLAGWLLVMLTGQVGAFQTVQLDVSSNVELQIPPLVKGKPSPGKRVAVTPSEYQGTNVFHTLYLPPDWKPDGPPLPIIFEYTGNSFPQSGSTGEVEDAGLGFGLGGGQFIWVSLPYINHQNDDNEVTWWGDEQATIKYAKENVPKIIQQFHADPNVVILCGFSRGAIGVNYLGLHDDEIAPLWTAFVTHDHFDGVRQWRNTTWGSPLDQYRKAARARLNRVAGRPYLVSQEGSAKATREYLDASLESTDSFTILEINTRKALGEFPNDIAIHPHTDRWLLKPSQYRSRAWSWINQVVSSPRRTQGQ